MQTLKKYLHIIRILALLLLSIWFVVEWLPLPDSVMKVLKAILIVVSTIFGGF
jgi:hypothetical protein